MLVCDSPLIEHLRLSETLTWHSCVEVYLGYQYQPAAGGTKSNHHPFPRRRVFLATSRASTAIPTASRSRSGPRQILKRQADSRGTAQAETVSASARDWKEGPAPREPLHCDLNCPFSSRPLLICSIYRRVAPACLCNQYALGQLCIHLCVNENASTVQAHLLIDP